MTSTDTEPRTDRRPDNRLDYVDQALYLGLRATGQAAVTMIVWVYDHPIDMDGVRRFHQDMGYGMAGRLIEPSILPFGRHRWVTSTGPATALRIAPEPRPRSELSDWIDESAQQPIDPEFGPSWHMSVLHMTDGSTAVSLVGSHCVADGGGALLTVYEGVLGLRRDLGYPPPRSRTRRQALLADTRQTLRDLPELGRTLVAAGRFLRDQRKAAAGAPKATPPALPAGADLDEAVVPPSVAVIIPIEEWDRRAAELGGNMHSLLAALSARLAVHQGRELAEDGTVSLIVPINDRTLEDARANAVKLAYVRVDPTTVTTDQTETRAAIREALRVMREKPDPAMELLPLTPFIPKVAVRRTADLAFGFAAQPTSCSNVGDLPVDVAKLDGTAAELVIMRGADQHVTRRVLEERQGVLTLVCGRLDGKVSMTIVGYQPGAINTKECLRERVATSLAELGLTAVVV
ncbi:hypothetical protein MMAD_26470 [Mycolicibacterium madagascariense]|uniref:Diacylglycerol O-acyltransferase n=1 Tax=Mycolicibacterium madagascariense TaxID=212765 RepID=A0A7I7XGL6_9MYCO|nr:hypothetical protein [Mycolicibacterium madagascariense]MCV7013300.1 hypothetical protein [Mycolicibacterium madagascariense]BBZ28352.1 hypothetical protein MMAD_26470 [Mycolicibacterium madagascariense]